MKFDFAKLVQILIWFVVVYNLLFPFSEKISSVFNLIGIALLVVHLGEYLFFHKTINQRPESRPLAFVMTIVFGILYWRDFPTKSKMK